MSIVNLYGHEAVKSKLARANLTSLPSSILLHGRKGIGKQRLAIWIAQMVLCDSNNTDGTPCGNCPQCKAVLRLQHPDLHWIFPAPRSKKPDPSPAEVFESYAEKIAERVEHHGLYASPPGTEAIYMPTTKALVSKASMRPAMADYKVFIVGDAERMVPQEGAEEAANAFLKLLEEPPADTRIVITSSEPGSLLPTIRSRVVSYRCTPLSASSMREFLADPFVMEELENKGLPEDIDERIALADGAPGSLLGAESLSTALAAARRLLDAAERRGSEAFEVALSQGVAGARGAFSDTLKALNVVLHERAANAVRSGDRRRALRATKGINAVARAQYQAERNVNPQLITARLIKELGP